MDDFAEAASREGIRQLVSRSGRSLDAGDFDSYVAMFSVEGVYRLEAFSEEIGREMTWLAVSRDELAALLQESPQHVHDLASRSHLITVDEIEFVEGGAEVLSSFAVFRTTPPGETQVYAVGEYRDRVVRNGTGGWEIAIRCARVRTRMFAAPTPMPL